ncbi:MAG TPA: type II toxin-antitoxin system VapC family toxin [Burkholderiales bacterium]|nr:type II toxin-antitoxin system VapC family toxin [Burkholderiales bacterium]
MVSVDTNVVIRLLTEDDPAQAKRARSLFERETILVPTTVLLEAEWVLRRLYGLDVIRIVNAFTALIALPNVRCEHYGTVVAALDWTRAGLDFADALHLAGGRAAEHFVTFDSKLVKRAKRITDLQVALV